MDSVKKLLAFLLAVAMLVTLFVGCDNVSTKETEKKPDSNNPSSERTSSGTLVIANNPMPGKFSPFYADVLYDIYVNDLMNLYLLGGDRAGEPVLHSGEKRVYSVSGKEYEYDTLADYDVTVNKDGTVDYDIKMREDIKYSDGTSANIDDIIFAIYVFADPSFDGNGAMYTLPIEGIQDYHGSMKCRLDMILDAGPDGYKENKYYTKEMYDYLWNYFNNDAIEAYIGAIRSFLVENEYCTEEDSIAVLADTWGYPDLSEDATYMDFWNAIVANYPSVEEAEINEQAPGGNHTRVDLMKESLSSEYLEYLVTDEGVDHIPGVIRTGDYSMRIHCTAYDPTTILNLSFPVCSRAFYGDPEYGYDYENHKFGFPRGDLSSVKAKTSTPTVTCGPYFFKSYEDNVVTLEANPYYIDGIPKIKTVKFQAVSEKDLISGVIAGTFDVCYPPLSKPAISSIEKQNSNGEISGDKLTTILLDHNGFGYLAANCERVCVDDKAGSEQSKNLRKAVMTAVAVCRNIGIETYYGELATVIEYPISRVSWAAPVPTDDDYKIAYSTKLDGSPIFTDSMTMEEKKRAVANACLEFLEAAGYKVENGKVTEAPAGAKGLTEETAYEVMIAGGGVQDHAAINVVADAKEILASIGFHIKISDVDGGTWENATKGRTVDFYAIAWNVSSPDPDMTVLYHSGETQKQNMTMIRDSKLDKLLVDARSSGNNTYRKAAYRQVFDILFDWANVCPLYQRKNATLISNENINVETLPEDMSPFYPWYAEIQNLELKLK